MVDDNSCIDDPCMVVKILFILTQGADVSGYIAGTKSLTPEKKEIEKFFDWSKSNALKDEKAT